MFLIRDLITLLLANLVFSQALGTSTLFVAASGRKNLIRTACVDRKSTRLNSSHRL